MVERDYEILTFKFFIMQSRTKKIIDSFFMKHIL
jgi:hypothetical protein